MSTYSSSSCWLSLALLTFSPTRTITLEDPVDERTKRRLRRASFGNLPTTKKKHHDRVHFAEHLNTLHVFILTFSIWILLQHFTTHSGMRGVLAHILNYVPLTCSLYIRVCVEFRHRNSLHTHFQLCPSLFVPHTYFTSRYAWSFGTENSPHTHS